MQTNTMDGNTENPNLELRSDAGFDYVAAWRSVRKYWATALGVSLAVALGITFYTLGQTKSYQATATVQFDPHPPRPLGKNIDTITEYGAGDYLNNREYYETQFRILQSMRVAMSVVQKLNLQHDGGFMDQSPPGPRAQVSFTPEEAAEALRKRLVIDPVKDSRLAVVRYDDSDPERAQLVMTTLIDTYVDQNLEDAFASTNSAVEWLRGQLDKLKVTLDSSEMALHDFKMSKNMLSVAFDDQSNMLREEMKQLNESLTTVRTKREEAAARNSELSKVAADPSKLPATELLQSPLLQLLRQRYQDAIREQESLLGEGKGPNHPDVEATAARVKAAQAALVAEIHNIQGAVERDLAIANKQETGLAGLFERAKRQALDLNLLEIEYNRLRRTKDNTEKLYSMVLERTKESDLTAMMRVNNIRVVDRPLLPRRPIKPRVAVNISIGVILGAALGIGAAMIRAILDRTIKTPDDVQRDLGLTFLGLLPEIEESSRRERARRRRRRPGKQPADGGSRELIVHQNPSGGIAEASRAIRTNLLFMAPDQPYKTLLVTSAEPSEGKTTVACCIAIAMAQAGQSVVVVDCDLRRPRVHRIFGKPSNHGVTSLLLGDASLEDETPFRTDIPNLCAVPAGPIPPNPAELLHSERFRSLLRGLAKKYDRVILDSPPLVAVTDAAVLSTLVDGTILVVRSFVTSRDIARHAVRSVRDVAGKMAGAVLNAVDLDRHEYQYYHYYYRRDEYYSSNKPEEADAAAQATH